MLYIIIICVEKIIAKIDIRSRGLGTDGGKLKFVIRK